MSEVLWPCSRHVHRDIQIMRYRKFNILTAVFTAFLLFSAVRAEAQDILGARVSRDTILIGDQIEWTSDIQVPRGMSVRIDSMSGYVVPGVELIGDFVIDTVERGKEYSRVRTKATITSFDSGSYVLPPLVVYICRGENAVDTLRLPEVPLEVTTVPIDTTTYEIYDIRPQFRYPVTFAEVLPWLAGAIALAALAVVICRLVARRRKNRPLFGKPTPQDPPHIVALRDLDRIRGEKLWQSGNQKQYYTEITDTLRVYIEKRFGIKTIERTSGEILVDLSTKDVQPSDYESLKDLFGTADLVKFAKYTATEAENENAVPVAVRFVNDTFMQELENAASGDGKAPAADRSAAEAGRNENTGGTGNE